MRQKSTLFSITLLALVLTASVHSQPRLNDDTNSNLDGSTITITPSSTYKVYCYAPGIERNWYKINGGRSTSIAKDPQPVPDQGYAKRSASGTLGLNFEPFRTNDVGEYQCRYSSVGQPSAFTTKTIYLTTPTPTPTPTPMPPSKVQGVTVTRTVQGSSPALRVSWSAVNGSGITYTVCYSTTSGTQSDPPSGANCSISGITRTSTTLGPLSLGTTYYIWVAAVSSGGRGQYSDRRRGKTYQVPSQVGPPVLTKAASSGRPALRVTWTTPSSERPITKYQVQYRRSGSTRWSTKDVTSSSTTLENLSAGSSYQVRVRAVSDVGSGPYSPIRTKTTYRVPEQVTGVGFTLNNTNNVLTLTITWDIPSSEQPITHYFVRLDNTQHKVAGVTTLTITGTLGSTYTFSVIAVSAVGSGAWSESVTAQPPSQPAINVTTPSTTTLTVKWDDKGFSYRVHVQKKGSTEINTFGPVTPPYKITGLESNTEYTVVVEAYNPLGSANRSVVGYTLPEVRDIKTNGLADSNASSVGLSAGLFIAGLFSGVIAMLLVEGIIRGVRKISKMSQKKIIEGTYTEPTTIQMSECPAYESIDREGKGAERLYEDIEGRDTKGD